MINIPTHMNAIVLEEAGGQAVLRQIPVPTPNAHQVLIKVDSAPINPSDLGFLKGSYRAVGPYPAVAGIEGSGVVVSEGPLQGKRVSFSTGEGGSGSYADYALTYAVQCCPVNDDISLQVAASSFVNPATVVGMLDVVKTANVTTVVQTAAASQLGRMMVRYFQENGVKVINVVRRQDQADILKLEGAEYTLNQTDADFFEKLTALTTELKATICFDAIGGEFAGQILQALPNKSTLYNYGGLSGKNIADVSLGDLIFKEKSIKGFWLTQWIQQDPSRLLSSQLTVQKNLGGVFKSVIAKEFTLEQFDDAVKFYVTNMTQGKTLLRPASSQ